MVESAQHGPDAHTGHGTRPVQQRHRPPGKNTATAESPWSSTRTMGISLWTTTEIRHLRKTATAGPHSFTALSNPKRLLLTTTGMSPACPRTATVTTTREATRPAQQGRRSPRSRTATDNHHGLLNSKTMGIGLSTTTEIWTTLSKNGNCGISTVFCVVSRRQTRNTPRDVSLPVKTTIEEELHERTQRLDSLQTASRCIGMPGNHATERY